MYIGGKREWEDVSYCRPAEQDDTYIKTFCELPSKYLLLLPLLTGKIQKNKYRWEKLLSSA